MRVFLVSEAERFTWLGVLLAKALPDVLRRPRRVAVALPSGLRLALRVFDPSEGLEARRAALAAFAPDAGRRAPHLLRLAAWPELRPKAVFSGSEVLDPPPGGAGGRLGPCTRARTWRLSSGSRRPAAS